MITRNQAEEAVAAILKLSGRDVRKVSTEMLAGYMDDAARKVFTYGVIGVDFKHIDNLRTAMRQFDSTGELD